MGLTIFIIGVVLGVGCFSYFIYSIIKFVKEHVIGENNPKIEGNLRLKLIVLATLQGALTIVSSIGMVLMKEWPLNPGEYVMLIFGSYLFGTSFAVLVSSFILYYYKVDLDVKQRKACRIALFSAIPVLIAGVILFTEGFADYVNRIASGISLKNGWSYPGDDDFLVKFYGIMILTGALVSYFVCDHYFFKKFKKHGIIDTLFVVALIFGILGARLWSCFVLDWSIYKDDILGIFDFRRGGLAIQGGVILGAITGISFILIFRKYVDLRFAIDVCIPAILLAQVIGRWGNFFNVEVYGAAVPRESLNWLPTIIANNMYDYGDYHVPLFLIEGMINLSGYFIIRYFAGKVCKCNIGLGLQASLYFVWYGLVRIVLEPLRDKEFEYQQSRITAFVMMGAGVALFITFLVIHLIRKNKNLENEYGEKI